MDAAASPTPSQFDQRPSRFQPVTGTVDHDSDIALVEAACVDTCITGASALFQWRIRLACLGKAEYRASPTGR